ncbi:hypothetical protein [Pseudomonas sp. SLFW]|uniref:hypothetical protein n=1 Tax=Pseudomonas sp. SLFW TaxID=2683259 RepID=UPI0014133F9A|nr:hypothetical protein [Pseudomonas sp. SLFW]NBB11778.1 hypothetical protein [Pseudomonas sp. SLFW]
MTDKPLKAYHVGEDSEGGHVITFATNSATARREGGNEMGLEFNEVSFCRRAQWADQFAGQPFIPAKAYHEQGWWLYCGQCETQLYEDAEDDDGNPLIIVYDGRRAYCDQNCKDSHDREIAELNARGEAFKEKLKGRPDLEFSDVQAGWPRITMSAKFKFAGCQYGGSVRDQEGDGHLTWYIAQVDQLAWDEYEAKRDAA